MLKPTNDAILATITRTVDDLFKSARRDEMSVKLVRHHAELDLNLDAGFLRQGDWKEQSKNAIETRVQQLLDAETEGESDTSRHPPTPKAARKKTKRVIQDANIPAPKRQKTSPDPERSHVSEQATKRRHSATRTHASPDFDDEDQSPKAARQRQRKIRHRAAEDSQSSPKNVSPVVSSKLLELKTSDTKYEQSFSHAKRSSREPIDQVDPTRSDLNTGQKPPEALEGSDSDLSSVLDEPATATHKRRPCAPKKPLSATHLVATTKRRPSQRPLTTDEATLKTLQTQLRKCGVKTIWQFALKKFGDDHQAKVRHLQATLKEVGMVGRFSEVKAKEIKEARELMADLQAVEEGDKIWGLESKRKTGKSSKIGASDDGEDDQCNPGSDLAVKSRITRTNEEARKPRSAALDWLGAEEDSDE